MSRWVQVSAVAVAVAASTLVPVAGSAADEVVIEVTTTVDVVDGGDGLTSVREAVSAAGAVVGAPRVRIVLGGGVHQLSICDGSRDVEDDANLDGDLDYSGTAVLELVGGTLRQGCDADSGERVLDADGHLSFTSVVVTGGDVAGDGGGVRATSLDSYQLAVHGNRASGDGGGVWVADSFVGGDSSLRDNHAGRDGGGLATGSLTLGDDKGSGIERNTAGRDGGGVRATGMVRLSDESGVRDNVAARDGGGIWADEAEIGTVLVDGEWDLFGTDVRGNRAGRDGGGVRARLVDARTSTFIANGAVGDGGAIWSGEAASVRTALLEANIALGEGAGLHAAGTATVERTTIVDSASLGEGAGAWVGGRAEIDRLFVGGSLGASAVVLDGGAAVDTLVVEGRAGVGVRVGDDPTTFRSLQVTGGHRIGVAIPEPEGSPAGTGGPHLLELSTVAGEEEAILAEGSDVRLAGVALLGDCDTDRPLPGPDPATAPPGSIGVQPSYATSVECDLRAPGSTVGGAEPAFEPAGDTQGFVPVADSPLVGAVDLPDGVEVDSWVHVDGQGWGHRPGVRRPLGPAADIGAREAAEPLVEPVAPRRVLDTRQTAPLRPGEVVDVQLPAGGLGAVLNVTVVDPTAATHLTVFPAGGSPPTSSTVNAPAGATVAAAAWVRPSPDGRISIRNQAGLAHVLVDVVGRLVPAGSGASAVTVVEPERAVDTRPGAPLAAGETRVLDLGDAVPAGADGAIVTVTGVGATAATHLTVWQPGTPRPGSSTLNLPVGATVANLALVPLDDEGRLAVRSAAGEVDVLVDVVAVLDEVAEEPSDADAGVVLRAPVRTFDSRALGAGGPLVGGAVRTVDLTRSSPSSIPGHARAAVVTLTLVAPSTASHLTVWAAGDPRPPTSNVNAPAGVTRATTAVVPLDGDGRAELRLSSGTAHVLVDVVGYIP